MSHKERKALSKANALIVDSSAVCRQEVKRLLQQAGINVYEATSGKEALGLVQQNKFDVVLLDVRLPVVDGFKSAELIRRFQGIHSSPMIFLTHDSDPKSIEKGYQLGCVDYITRPFDHQLFLDKILTLVSFNETH